MRFKQTNIKNPKKKRINKLQKGIKRNKWMSKKKRINEWVKQEIKK